MHLIYVLVNAEHKNLTHDYTHKHMQAVGKNECILNESNNTIVNLLYTLHACTVLTFHTLTHTHSSCQTVGKWQEMHGQMPLSHGLTTSCSLLQA